MVWANCLIEKWHIYMSVGGGVAILRSIKCCFVARFLYHKALRTALMYNYNTVAQHTCYRLRFVVVFVVISQFNVSFRQCWHNFICEYRWRGTPLLAGARVAPSVVACGGCRGCRSINFDVCFLYCKNFSAEITEIKNGMTLRCADPRLHRPRRYLPHL